MSYYTATTLVDFVSGTVAVNKCSLPLYRKAIHAQFDSATDRAAIFDKILNPECDDSTRNGLIILALIYLYQNQSENDWFILSTKGKIAIVAKISRKAIHISVRLLKRGGYYKIQDITYTLTR